MKTVDLGEQDRIVQLVRSLVQQGESEYLEFKHNNFKPDEVGEYFSALSNSAALHGMQFGYLIWGVDNQTRQVVGTSFDPSEEKVSNQELESWISNHLHPRVDFRFHQRVIDGHSVVIAEIPAAREIPVRFKDFEYIRVGSYKKKLRDYPQKEQSLWAVFRRTIFETDVALEHLEAETVLGLLDYHAYFELTGQPLPNSRETILERLIAERFITKTAERFDITNLGAILFARNLERFPRLSRKALRVIVYKGSNRLETVRERLETKGYAMGFADSIRFIKEQVPGNEYIEEVFRREMPMYPERALRELSANCLIHQDFAVTGAGPTIELYQDRIEITNPGQTLVEIDRLIDQPPRSRNEALASFMRRINLCEERGSGIDKVIAEIEVYQLPPPDFRVSGDNFIAVLYALRKYVQMSPKERIRACYQHACLLYVSNRTMTNATLRERFGIEEKNYPMASKVISETTKAGFIKPGETMKTYVPFWA